MAKPFHKNRFDGGHTGARTILVWDPLVRLIHWSVALIVLLNATVFDEDGRLHEWMGYTALGLVAIRLVWGLIGPSPARFSAFPPDLRRARHHLRSLFARTTAVHLSHNPLGALMVYNVWLTVIALGLTGYMMGTPRFFGMEWVEELHELFFGWLMLSVALHIAGVLFDSWRSGVNLARAMVNGHKEIPKGTTLE